MATDPTGYISIPPELMRGVSWKQPVRVASTGNLTLSGTQTIDGVACVAGDRVLAKDQTTGSARGIYVVASGAWTRAFDMDQDLTTAVPAQEVMGAVIYVIAGTVNGGTLWRCTNTSAPTLGSTTLTFATLGSADLSGIDFLVGTATGLLSGEIVAGTTPGGELGGTWGSPTVDATHSGSAHTDFIAKAIVDVKGDLIAATAADSVARVPVGTDGDVLTADSGASAGVSWQPGTSDPADDTAVWMPLTTVVGGVPDLVWDADDSLIPTLTPI